MPRRLFTSESVTEGHPDKIADQISDSILDAMLAQDPRSRVAVETMITTGQVHIAGEVTTAGYVDIASIVRDTVLRIGYDSSRKGFDGASCGVSVSIGAQSPDIAQGVDTGYEARTSGTAEDEIERQGAGDQGLMFGYATDETPELMPLPIALAHRLARRLSAVRKDGSVPYLRPDGKTQVTVVYEDDQPVAVDTVVVSSQHAEDISIEQLLTPDIQELVVEPELAALGLPTDGYRLLVNPTGKFVIGGPMGDAGLTGRKIIVDTYGGMARHGGGAFSGKDPSKVDRSGAYAMRWVAKNVVAAGPGQALRGAGRLRDRRRAPGRPVRRDLRHRHRRRRRPREGDHHGVRPAPRRDRARPRPAAADLRADRGLRPLRPHRRRAPLGAAGPRRRPPRGRRAPDSTGHPPLHASTTRAPRARRGWPGSSSMCPWPTWTGRSTTPCRTSSPTPCRPAAGSACGSAASCWTGSSSSLDDATDFTGKLLPLAHVPSGEPVLTPQVARLARVVADRYAGTMGDVLRLALPPRRADAGEAADADPRGAARPARPGRLRPVPGRPGAADARWPRAGRRGRSGRRCPGEDWPTRLVELCQAALSGRRGALVVVPDGKDLDRLAAAAAAAAAGALVHGAARRRLPGEALPAVPRRLPRRGPGRAGHPGGDVRAGARPRPGRHLGRRRRPALRRARALSARPRRARPAGLAGQLRRRRRRHGAHRRGGAAGRVRLGARARRRPRRAARRRRPGSRRSATTSSWPATPPPARRGCRRWRTRRPAGRWPPARPVLVQVPRRGYVPVAGLRPLPGPGPVRPLRGPAGHLAAAGPGRRPHPRLPLVRPPGGDLRLPALPRHEAAGRRRGGVPHGRGARPGLPRGRRAHLRAARRACSRRCPAARRSSSPPRAPSRWPRAATAPRCCSTRGRCSGRADLRAGEETLRRWLNAAALVRPAVGRRAGRRRRRRRASRRPGAGALGPGLAGRARARRPPRAGLPAGHPDRRARRARPAALAEFLEALRLPEGADLLGPVPEPPRPGSGGGARALPGAGAARRGRSRWRTR